jgi:limonene 1,2-monooxygenase
MRETGCGCGAGPGLLASDALVLGIDPMTQRDRMAEGIDVIPRLFRGETVTEKTDWYTLVGAKLHLPPYTKPYPETEVVSAVTPSGGRLAGKYDLGMICVAATNPFGYGALASNWQIACDIAAEHGRTMDPARLRLVGPMHIAETREKAFANARFGFEKYLNYLNNNQRRFYRAARPGPARMVCREQLRRRRHAERRDRIDRALAGEAGRVRRLPAATRRAGRG